MSYSFSIRTQWNTTTGDFICEIQAISKQSSMNSITITKTNRVLQVTVRNKIFVACCTKHYCFYTVFLTNDFYQNRFSNGMVVFTFLQHL